RRVVLVGVESVAAQETQSRNLRELPTDLLGHTVGEILLLWVRGKAAERPNGQKRPLIVRGYRGLRSAREPLCQRRPDDEDDGRQRGGVCHSPAAARGLDRGRIGFGDALQLAGRGRV